MKARRILCSKLLRRLVSWAVAECCRKTYSWPLNRVVRRGFTAPYSTSYWYTRTHILHKSSRNECHTLRGQLTVTKEVWLPPCTHRTHLKGLLTINLVVLVVILLLRGENFLIREDIFVSFSAYNRRRRSVLVRRISIKAGVRRCPFERKWAVICSSSLMKHNLIGSICKAIGTWSVSRAVVRQVRSRNILIQASALTIFRHPDWAQS